MIDETRNLPDATANIFFRIKGVINSQTFCGRRHQLHQTHRPATAHRIRIVGRLDPNQRINERGIDPMLPADRLHQLAQISPVQSGSAGIGGRRRNGQRSRQSQEHTRHVK